MLVTFHCQASGWYPDPSVSWVVSGTTVDRGDYNTSSLQDPNGLFNSTSVLQIKAETSSSVECWASVSAAVAHQSKRCQADLAPKAPQDYTVVIAVIVSVCTIILLAVLILILYYRKKLSKSSSGNKVSSSSWTVNLSRRRRSVADETRGKVNPGYHAEDITSS
ncbi:hypothetical protein cypCar_00029760 [Cyprinus carpio]|nr:hypothetical protein cypCar_00029760 [Cyprinus carpio]